MSRAEVSSQVSADAALTSEGAPRHTLESAGRLLAEALAAFHVRIPGRLLEPAHDTAAVFLLEQMTPENARNRFPRSLPS